MILVIIQAWLCTVELYTKMFVRENRKIVVVVGRAGMTLRLCYILTSYQSEGTEGQNGGIR